MAVGYGIEFTFTTMERIRQGAILVNDVSLQMPLFANIGKECWISREARKSKEQGIIMEAISGVALLLAGANVLVLRHPESYHLLKAVTERTY
jgi:acetyl-CoA decarbonylase/synthase complex subunit delta